MEYKENYLYYDDNYDDYNQTRYNSLEVSFFPELIVLFFFSYTTAMICRCFKGVCFNNNSNNSNNRIYNSDIESRLIPNLSQIDKKTISYEELLNDNNDDDCTICLEEFNNDDEIVKLKCNHLFHSKCIDDWIEKNQSCPLCRVNLL
jgi:hypothetical protein